MHFTFLAMVQTFMVVQCVDCELFQVHQVRKVIYNNVYSFSLLLGEKVQQQMDMQSVYGEAVGDKGRKGVWLTINIMYSCSHL